MLVLMNVLRHPLTRRIVLAVVVAADARPEFFERHRATQTAALRPLLVFRLPTSMIASCRISSFTRALALWCVSPVKTSTWSHVIPEPPAERMTFSTLDFNLDASSLTALPPSPSSTAPEPGQ